MIPCVKMTFILAKRAALILRQSILNITKKKRANGLGNCHRFYEGLNNVMRTICRMIDYNPHR
jgi:hypothetical protein